MSAVASGVLSGERQERGLIEIMTFRLVGSADEARFLEADRRVQTEFAGAQPGLLSRTTAKGADGEWIVIDRWRSAEDADACDARWGADDATKQFMAFVERASLRVASYETVG